MKGIFFSRMGFIMLVFLACHITVFAQNPVYVDQAGVMRRTKDKKEASFFGVNYTVPFAYGYRSVKALGKDLKETIDEDVSHFARLDLDAFRVINPNTDRTQLVMYNPDWRNNSIRFVPSEKTTQLSVQVLAKTLSEKQVMGWQFYIGDKLKGRQTELTDFKFMVIKARSENATRAKVSLITQDAFSFSTNLEVGKEWKEIRIPISSLQSDSMLLLPRPFPGFLPLWFKVAGNSVLKMADAEKVQVVCFGEGKGADLEITSIWLEK